MPVPPFGSRLAIRHPPAAGIRCAHYARARHARKGLSRGSMRGRVSDVQAHAAEQISHRESVLWGGGHGVVVEEDEYVLRVDAGDPFGPRPELAPAVPGLGEPALVEPHVGP